MTYVLNFRQKLVAPTLIVVAAMLVATGVSYRLTTHAAAELDRVERSHLPALRLAQELEAGVAARQRVLQDAAAAEDPTLLALADEQHAELVEQALCRAARGAPARAGARARRGFRGLPCGVARGDGRAHQAAPRGRAGDRPAGDGRRVQRAHRGARRGYRGRPGGCRERARQRTGAPASGPRPRGGHPALRRSRRPRGRVPPRALGDPAGPRAEPRGAPHRGGGPAPRRSRWRAATRLRCSPGASAG